VSAPAPSDHGPTDVPKLKTNTKRMGVKKTMNAPRLLAATLSLGAATLALTSAAFAQEPASGTTTTPATGTTQGTTTPSGTMQGSSTMMSADGKPTSMTGTDGRTVVMVGPNTSAADRERARWAFYNADRASVNRIKAMGFTEDETRRILNLALKTGLEVDYITRRVQVSGYSIAELAGTYGVNARSLDDELIGFNADSLSMMGSNAGTPAMSVGSTTTTTTTTGSSAMAAKGDILDVAASDPQLSTFLAAVRQAGLQDALKGAGPYTIFAPTNAAFAKLPAGTLDDLMKDENKDRLASILQYHVLTGRVMSADIMGMSNPSSPATLGGGTLNVKTTSPIMVNDAGVVQADVPATNGVIHLIDTVLLPGTAASGSTGGTTNP